MTIGIEAIEYYLPERFLTSEELASKFGFDLQFIEEKLGVKKIYTAEKHVNTSDLAVEAIRKISAKYPAIYERVGVIAVVTQTPDYQLPHTAAIIHKKLGLKNGVACFDISLGCSGFVYGLSLVKAFMEDNDVDCGLLVTAETYSKVIDDNDRNTKALFSDAAAVSLLGRQPYLVPQRFTFGTNGDGYESLIVRPRNSQLSDNNRRGYLHMDGRGIFEFVASKVPVDINKCLQVNGLGLDEIDLFVLHQASNFMLDTLAKKLKIKEGDKVMRCIEKYGNTVSSSIPIALAGIFDDCKQRTLKILISGFGVGLSWGSTVLFTKEETGNV